MGLRITVAGANFSTVGLGNINGVAYDFIAAAGITDPTQKSAINTLKQALIDAGVWAKATNIYPFIGSTYGSQKFNLKDPRDLDAAGRLVVLSGSHAAGGFTGIANSFKAPVTLSDYCIAVFTGTSATSANKHVMGVSGGNTAMYIERSDNTSQTSASMANSTAAFGNASTDINKAGLLTASRESASLATLYDGGTNIATDTVSRSLTAGTGVYPIYVGGLNFGGTTTGAGNIQIRFAYIGLSLTASQVAAMNTAVIAFNTALGR